MGSSGSGRVLLSAPPSDAYLRRWLSGLGLEPIRSGAVPLLPTPPPTALSQLTDSIAVSDLLALYPLTEYRYRFTARLRSVDPHAGH
jgi:hypothetical protein